MWYFQNQSWTYYNTTCLMFLPEKHWHLKQMETQDSWFCAVENGLFRTKNLLLNTGNLRLVSLSPWKSRAGQNSKLFVRDYKPVDLRHTEPKNRCIALDRYIVFRNLERYLAKNCSIVDLFFTCSFYLFLSNTVQSSYDELL